MKCPRCGKRASFIFSYIKRYGLNKYTKEALKQDRRTESVMLTQYQCHHGHGQFLHKSNSPLPDLYAFNVDRPKFELLNYRIDWRTKEEWEKTER